MKKSRIPDLLSELKEELALLGALAGLIKEVSGEVPTETNIRSIYRESLALKLHNFYTGCERIFRKIAEDLNGGVPQSPDWHRRLLRTMALDIEGVRPRVLTKETMKELEEYLSFRHVIRNIYGFEINDEKLMPLLSKFEKVWNTFEKEIRQFIDDIKQLGI